MNTWPLVETEDGSWTLAHPGHGQACHSRSGAWLESLERYARPCRLAELARERGPAKPVRLLDVGLGVGWNVAAALSEVRLGGGGLEVLGLELEADLPGRSSELAELSGPGPWSPHFEDVVSVLSGRADFDELKLELRLGDATETMGTAGGFDAVFLDAFSPGVEFALWRPEFLGRLAQALRPGGILSTYTVAGAVQVGLAQAGLRVGAGPLVGAKRAGTLASWEAELPPLPGRAQRRLERLVGPR